MTLTTAKEIQRRRTFAIISHPDAGKTTMTEKLLLYGGAIHMAGSEAGSTAIKTLCPPDITYDEIRLMRELRGDSPH